MFYNANRIEEKFRNNRDCLEENSKYEDHKHGSHGNQKHYMYEEQTKDGGRMI